jgi:hypothetical protein
MKNTKTPAKPSLDAPNAEAKTHIRERRVVENTFEISGAVFEIGDLRKYPNGYKRRELILLTEDYRPQAITFQFQMRKVDLLNGVGRGERVILRFRLEGRPGDNRYFNNLIVLDLQKMSQTRIEGLGDEKYLEQVERELNETEDGSE